ncbi:MAG: mannose-6-phosphate isomerase, class I [Treponema sp.]|nr:mannose-6-phosphate isomerase, class I [Treponema sp.]
MPKNQLLIDVLGLSLQISADEDPDYLQKILKILRQKTEETTNNTGLKDPLKIAVLTGFLLCDELEKKSLHGNNNSADMLPLNAENNPENGEAETLALNLISRLGEVLGIENSESAEIEGSEMAGTDRTGLDMTGQTLKKDDFHSKAYYEVYKLKNAVKYHDWGSPDLIPGLVGDENKTRTPWAELWMGVHPEGPSRIIRTDLQGNGQKDLPLLSELIAENPGYFLGKANNLTTLPFLFKILAAEKPLSIQAHPNLTQAKQGWERENAQAIPVNSPYRNYKDTNHKPEILCALTPFTAMAGFRHPEEIKNLMVSYFEEAPRDLKAAVFPLLNALDEKETPLKKFLASLLAFAGPGRTALSAYAAKKKNSAESAGNAGSHNEQNHNNEWELISRFGQYFPGDPAIISPLYLNLIHLNPGEAIFLPAGVLHAYVSGMGVELMANSDNVLRGGLTTKHIDIPELFRIVDFMPFMPEVYKESGSTGIYQYPAACTEFSLAVIHGGRSAYPITGPSIVFVTEGTLSLTGKSGKTVLKKGESAFIAADDSGLELDGNYTFYAARTGTSRLSL